MRDGGHDTAVGEDQLIKFVRPSRGVLRGQAGGGYVEYNASQGT
jgi:hypothetical protein